MTTPVTTSEPFTLTGVFSCANACAVARTTKAAVNTANRETVLFTSTSPNAKTPQTPLYFPAWGSPLSVIYDHLSVISDHRKRIQGNGPCRPLCFFAFQFGCSEAAANFLQQIREEVLHGKPERYVLGLYRLERSHNDDRKMSDNPQRIKERKKSGARIPDPRSGTGNQKTGSR